MTRVVLMSVLAVVGCKQNVDLGGEFRTVLDVEPEPITALDILFVVDNSGSMSEEQRQLIDSVGAYLFATIEADLGELPDLHVAVISTDVGAGNYNISGCTGAGDDGLLQSEPRIAGCTPPSDSFLQDAPDPEGGRLRNFDGSLADAFACIARLGIDGCAFEQPLESARRALDGRNPENDGFVRDDALLLLVVMTDEDDCSVFDTEMFDTEQNALDDPLGPLSSYRCFEFCVTCDEDPRVPGERTGCRPREDSEFMTSVSEFADFFRGLKSDPSRVAVSVISGGSANIEVGADVNGNPKLEPVCELGLRPPECETIVWPPDAGPGEPPPDYGPLTPDDCRGGPGEVQPSVRLDAFLAQFPGRAHFGSMCDFTIASHLESTARLAADVMGRSPCLRGALVDADRDRDGIQTKCRGYDVAMAAGVEQDRTTVPSCADSGGVLPCFTVAEHAECGHVETKLAAQVQRGGESSGRPTHFVVECLTPLGGQL